MRHRFHKIQRLQQDDLQVRCAHVLHLQAAHHSREEGCKRSRWLRPLLPAPTKPWTRLLELQKVLPLVRRRRRRRIAGTSRVCCIQVTRIMIAHLNWQTWLIMQHFIRWQTVFAFSWTHIRARVHAHIYAHCLSSCVHFPSDADSCLHF